MWFANRTPPMLRATASSGWTTRHVAAASAVALVALPLSLAVASDGRRLTLGANRPTYDLPASSMMPYDQAAISPYSPQVSRPAESSPLPAVASSKAAKPTTSEAPAIRVLPPGTQAAQSVVAPAQPGATDATASSSPPQVKALPAHPRVAVARYSAKTADKTVKVAAAGSKVVVREKSVRVEAPATKVAIRENKVRVDAPLTRVAVDDGRVRVRAPFVDIDIRF